MPGRNSKDTEWSWVQSQLDTVITTWGQILLCWSLQFYTAVYIFFHKTEHCFIRNSKNNIINIVVVTPGTKFTPIRIMHNCSVITITIFKNPEFITNSHIFYICIRQFLKILSFYYFNFSLGVSLVH